MKRRIGILMGVLLTVVLIGGCAASSTAGENALYQKQIKTLAGENVWAGLMERMDAASEPIYIIYRDYLMGSYEKGQWNSFLGADEAQYFKEGNVNGQYAVKRREINMSELLGKTYYIYQEQQLERVCQNAQKEIGPYRGIQGYVGTLYLTLKEHEYLENIGGWRFVTNAKDIPLKQFTVASNDRIEQSFGDIKPMSPSEEALCLQMVKSILADYDTVVIADELPFQKLALAKGIVEKAMVNDIDNDGEDESIIMAFFSPMLLDRCYELAKEEGLAEEFAAYLAEKTDSGQRNMYYTVAFVENQRGIKPLQIYTGTEEYAIEVGEILDVNHDGYWEILLRYHQVNDNGAVRGFALFAYDKQGERYVEVLRTEVEPDSHDFVWMHLPYLFARQSPVGWIMRRMRSCQV